MSDSADFSETMKLGHTDDTPPALNELFLLGTDESFAQKFSLQLMNLHYHSSKPHQQSCQIFCKVASPYLIRLRAWQLRSAYSFFWCPLALVIQISNVKQRPRFLDIALVFQISNRTDCSPSRSFAGISDYQILNKEHHRILTNRNSPSREPSPVPVDHQFHCQGALFHRPTFDICL